LPLLLPFRGSILQFNLTTAVPHLFALFLTRAVQYIDL
jgi:hypothetical protein